MVKIVLVVEDDLAMATLVKDALEGVGLQVVVEKDGEAGLRACQRNFRLRGNDAGDSDSGL